MRDGPRCLWNNDVEESSHQRRIASRLGRIAVQLDVYPVVVGLEIDCLAQTRIEYLAARKGLVRSRNRAQIPAQLACEVGTQQIRENVAVVRSSVEAMVVVKGDTKAI